MTIGPICLAPSRGRRGGGLPSWPCLGAVLGQRKGQVGWDLPGVPAAGAAGAAGEKAKSCITVRNHRPASPETLPSSVSTGSLRIAQLAPAPPELLNQQGAGRWVTLQTHGHLIATDTERLVHLPLLLGGHSRLPRPRLSFPPGPTSLPAFPSFFHPHTTPCLHLGGPASPAWPFIL